MNEHKHDYLARPEAFILPIVLIILFNIVIDRALYADFGFMFLQVLQEQHLFTFNQPHRIVNAILTQGPMLIAERYGVNDLQILKQIFNSSMYGVHLCFIFAIMAVRFRPEELIFPVVSYLSASLFFQFFMTEAQLTASIAWLLAVLIFPNRSLSTSLQALTLASAVALMLTYETSIAFALLFITAISFRIRSDATTVPKKFWITLMLIFVIGIFVQMYYVFHPLSPQNISTFAALFEKLKGNAFLGVIPAFALVGMALGLSPLRQSNVTCFTLVLLGVLSFEIIGRIWPTAYDSVPRDEYPLRSLMFIVPFGIMMLFVLYENFESSRIFIYRSLLATSFLLLGFQIMYQLTIGIGWKEYMDRFKEIVDGSEKPVVSLIDTKLFNANLNKYNWTWTLPSLSFLLATDGDVKTIVEDCYNTNRIYGIYAPPPALGRYGIQYSYLARIGAHADVKRANDMFDVTQDGENIRFTAKKYTLPSSGVRIKLERPMSVLLGDVSLRANEYDAYLMRYYFRGELLATSEIGPGSFVRNSIPGKESIRNIDEIAVDRVCGERGFLIDQLSFQGRRSPALQ